jgi:hypothetical protein
MEPQEDAMLRSRLSLCVNDRHPEPFTTLPWCIRDRRERFLLLAALGGLIWSAPTLSGQTNGSSSEDQRANSQVQICDGLKNSNPHQLSLGPNKEQSTDTEAGTTEQQSSSQSSSESTYKNLNLPQDNLSSSATQDQELICKRKKSGTELGLTHDPSPPSVQAAAPEPLPIIPTVSYANGMLTINAQNVPLRDVIDAIRVRAGIFVEFPAEPIEHRVFDHVGPAPLRDALTQLLYGSGLNYAIQTSSQDPQNVTRLILSSQPHLASAGSQQHANQPVVDQAETPVLYGAGGFANESPGEPSQPIPPANQPTPTASSVAGVPANFNLQQAAAASGKTPGQILDELQKHQLQVLDEQSPPPQ